MKQEHRQLKTHRLAEKLITYLRSHQPATIPTIVLAGVMTATEARGGLQYGIRHGVIERVKRPGATNSDRLQYQLTGRCLPKVMFADNDDLSAPSFDALLSVWGIEPVPPPVPTHAPGRIITFSGARE
jgi:hypothetical protein